MAQPSYIDLATLQDVIKGQIGEIQAWVKAEIDSISCSGGHYYMGLLQKSPKGAELAKARAIIWRWKADLVTYFRKVTGKDLDPGMELLMYVSVNYDARYGLSLIVSDIDADFTEGQREAQRKAAIKTLTDEGLMEHQKGLELPFLPGRIAVISSAEAAGYGDFIKQLSQNQYGYHFDLQLFHSVMQGDGSPSSIIDSLGAICEEEGAFDLIVIMRGGGAQSDMFCFDDLEMCRSIATCPIPVLTAIGHDRDFHIADMVACDYFKTPTALAAYLIDWVAEVEDMWMETVRGIARALEGRITAMETETARCLSNICFALNASAANMEHQVSLLESRIKAADPRAILNQGYVLASDAKGNIIKSADQARKGDNFKLRFRNGLWDCGVNDVKLSQ